jgi:BON domain-containing protein
MMEPFFGAPSPFGAQSPMWGATALPGFGWTTSSISPGSRGTGATSPAPLPLQSPMGVAATLPTFVTTEPAVGPTAAAVVAVVAMRRGQPVGPTTDAEIEDFLYDAFDLIPGTSEVEVRCEGGRVTLTGNVPNKRHKRDVGEIAWTIPSINDVQNNATITARRRTRAGREAETQPASSGRKQG